MKNWSGTRVLIIGAARQGQALARWLARHGARVTVNDLRPLDEMRAVQQSLADVDVEWVLGGHPQELLERVDVICPSGGVPLTMPIVAEALRRGIPLSNDTQIFLEAAPCKTIGISGSAGKTTTTTLVGEMAKLSFKDESTEMKDESDVLSLSKGRKNEESSSRGATLHPSSFIFHPSVFVGGNMGDPLINYVDEMTSDSLAILEISSFQLEQMTLSVNIAAVLNVTPNHLDRHGTMSAYTAAKARLLDFQNADDIAILNRDDDGSWGLRDHVRGHLRAFSLRALDPALSGSCLDGNLLSLRGGATSTALLAREKIQLRGEHNLSNVLAAFAIGSAAGLSVEAMRAAAESFRGVAHRLELVRELHGVRWYNDSIATAPERTMADIRSFDEPIVLLLGGRDKDLSWDDLAQLVHQRVEHVVLFGEAAEKIEAALGPLAGVTRTQVRCETLEAAIRAAAQVASRGDVVLFSPGGTSYDAFKDFAERGEKFKAWVSQLS